MAELVITVLAGMLVLGVTLEVFTILGDRAQRRYEDGTRRHLLEELRRHE